MPTSTPRKYTPARLVLDLAVLGVAFALFAVGMSSLLDFLN